MKKSMEIPEDLCYTEKNIWEGIIMSRADELYRATCLDILENGFYDTDLEVRPRWADGTPAHTVKKSAL